MAENMGFRIFMAKPGCGFRMFITCTGHILCKSVSCTSSTMSVHSWSTNLGTKACHYKTNTLRTSSIRTSCSTAYLFSLHTKTCMASSPSKMDSPISEALGSEPQSALEAVSAGFLEAQWALDLQRTTTRSLFDLLCIEPHDLYGREYGSHRLEYGGLDARTATSKS
mmetsp:Transcript_77013/g.133273  ORF Transcript_77013/g.133273 Transcript_77013/m.133273 type:complete len:167 (+) Transcript_77013:278-778(+)